MVLVGVLEINSNFVVVVLLHVSTEESFVRDRNTEIHNISSNTPWEEDVLIQTFTHRRNLRKV